MNITGAASGFGALTARALAKKGHTVYAGIRVSHPTGPAALSSITSFASTHNVDLLAVDQDVLSDSSVTASISHIIKESGRIDVLIHNAGHMCLGPTESFTTAQLAHMYDINMLSTQRLNRAVLSHMRKAQSGLVVWVSSSSVLGGTPPFLAPYFAAKAGMDALAASYAPELKRWDMETSIVVPGAFVKGTEHFATAMEAEDTWVVGKYLGEGQPYEGVAEEADVAEVAGKIVEVVEMEHGERPSRVYVDPAEDGAEVVGGVRDRIRREMSRGLGLEGLI
ncbi:short-chain dehydrogenase/reductase SDR [Aulographum hederae CBS 113979]|uniref:Short-chain dehydrogenase/reductase SDR n=1 Tax=Aulographum hederae CBS 113979 TaxID=1176131 RepID=A0A6G1HFU4_9PEZI|nr:short-chain dehydrogenase/reductase SDR [Aulographum hederae CBS 113979]